MCFSVNALQVQCCTIGTGHPASLQPPARLITRPEWVLQLLLWLARSASRQQHSRLMHCTSQSRAVAARFIRLRCQLHCKYAARTAACLIHQHPAPAATHAHAVPPTHGRAPKNACCHASIAPSPPHAHHKHMHAARPEQMQRPLRPSAHPAPPRPAPTNNPASCPVKTATSLARPAAAALLLLPFPPALPKARLTAVPPCTRAAAATPAAHRLMPRCSHLVACGSSAVTIPAPPACRFSGSLAAW